MGNLSDNDSLSATAGSIIGGLIPGVGLAADIRDFGAAVSHVASDKEGAWLELGASIIGFVPGGDIAKGIAKGATKASAKGAAKVAGETVQEIGKLAKGSTAAAADTASNARKAVKGTSATPRGPPDESHHFATNKNKKYAPHHEEIAKKYGLKLDDRWNIDNLPHRGRHPNEYHDFVQERMDRAAREAGNDKGKFLELFDRYVKQPVRDNPNLLRKSGWK